MVGYISTFKSSTEKLCSCNPTNLQTIAINKIDHYIPIIVQFEETTKLSGFKNIQALGVRQISDVAVKNGISYKNPFLIYLRILFDQKPY